jgi:hypothetical protein
MRAGAGEHTFRFLKQQLGWIRPLLRDPAAADRWTRLLVACYAQLWLARDLAAVTPASTAKPCQPGPGRPKGSKNKHKAPRHRPGKTTLKQRVAKNPRKDQTDGLNDKITEGR